MAKPVSPDAHWRDSARAVRFFFFDYRAAFPLVFFILHPRAWTFWVTLVAVIFFSLIERKGLTVVIFLRLLRGFFAGKRKVAHPWWQSHRSI